MLELLQKTPTWVYVVFVVLFIFGLKQRKARKTTPAVIYSLPAALIFYSILEMYFSIGINPFNIVCWLMGLVVGVLFFNVFLHSKDIVYDLPTRKFQIPGSWLPFKIMMGIFTVKYIYGAVVALDPQAAQTALFLQIFSGFNGVFCGIFSARIYSYWNISKATVLES